jgi:AraC family transcriptional regulator
VVFTAALASPPPGRAYRSLRHSSGLRLVRCACRAGARDRPSDEEHQAFSVTLVERGTFGYRTEAGQALLTPGWLMLGNERTAYVCSHDCSDGSGDDCVELSLSAHTLEDASSALGLSTSRMGFGRACLPPSPRVTALLAALLTDGDQEFALEETALAVISNVQRALHDGAAPAPVRRQDERALAAARYVESHAAEPLLLADVASAVGLSLFHLLRIFRRAIGVTPHQYLMRVRLLRAIALLRDTAEPVTAIAYAVGWTDLSNFTRTFTRDVGCNPGDFRRGGKKLLGERVSPVDRA